MLNMNQKLIKREEQGKIIKVGVVGAGQMGRGMVTQMVLMKGITRANCASKNIGRSKCSYGSWKICCL